MSVGIFTAPEAKEPTSPPRWVLSVAGAQHFFIPADAPAVPPVVAEANKRALQRRQQYEQARLEVFAAREEVKRSPSLDRSADRAAAAAGKPLPKARALEKAREALEQAERRFAAARGAMRESQLTLAAAVNEYYEPWAAKLDDHVREQSAELRQTIRALGEQVRSLRTARAVCDGLAALPRGGGSLVGVRWDRGLGRPADLDRAESSVREGAGAGNLRTHIPRTVEDMLAGLLYEVDALARHSM